MIKMLVTLCVLAVMVLGGCASSVRYTPDEIKGFPPKVQDFIMKGEVAPGMPPAAVRYAWGNPDQVNVLSPENGKEREEWVYSSNLGFKKTHVLFFDGKVAQISEK
ncbi:MAG TPA: hypothetical protein VLH56_09380 [Dissulfurispiraceae bacterium]|nr:hypothetical protein [Dissulfurispiraceae bacterium]